MERNWFNWCTIEDLSRLFGVSKRRAQQIVSELREKDKVEVGVLIYDDKKSKYMTTRPIYRLK